MSYQISNLTQLFAQKKHLRTLMKQVLKLISDESKKRQSSVVINHLLNDHFKFKNSNHISVYLAMKHEEIDTTLLIERLLNDQNNTKRIYVPHFEKGSKSHEMQFYEIKDINQYMNEMNIDNKFGIRQFSNVRNLKPADPNLFDLIICPGLAFDYNSDRTKIKRLGRGKGYYDSFLHKIPQCYSLGIGFNEQFISLNEELLKQNVNLPIIETKDFLLDEFLCEKMVN